MARSEARILTAVWRNADFTALPRSAQGLYWMLLSQPDVSLAGVVPLVERRWRGLSTDKHDELDGDLDTLCESGFLVIDEDSGEVWIRTFTKHDGVLRSPKTRAGMWGAFCNIMSPRIRGAFLDAVKGDLVDEAKAEGWVSEDDLRVPDTPRHTPSPRAGADSDTDTYSDNDSDTDTHRGAITPLREPIEDAFDDFWERYPRGKAGKPGGDGPRKPAKAKFCRLSDHQRDLALAAVDNYRAHVESPDGPHAAHAITWLNQERWEQWQEPAKPSARDGPQRITAGTYDALADEWERRAQ